jgi:hypothetical protein
MINVNQLFLYTQVLANKDQTGADFTPDDFNIVLPESVYELIRTYYGAPKRQPVQPLLTFEKNQAIKDYLTPLLKTVRLTPKEGMIFLPEDYAHLDDISYEYYIQEQVVCIHCGSINCSCKKPPKGSKKAKQVNCDNKKSKKVLVPLTVVNNSQWSNLFTDAINYPIDTEPYAQFYGEDIVIAKTGNTRKIQMEIAPQDLPQVIVKYVKLIIPEPKWGSDPVGGFSVYNPLTSVDIPLPRILLQELSWIILEAMGIHTREYWLQQISQQKVVTGV